jgi:hypothetical protein
MTDILNPSEFNAMFSAALNGGQDAMTKLGEATGLFIQDKLREGSLARKILPPQTVSERELVRSVDNDSDLFYIDDLEPDSIAMNVNMRSEPEKVYIEGKRYSIRISMVSSQRFQKTEQELRTYRMPLTKVIEQNTVKDMQERWDTMFMQHVKAGIFLATLHRHNQLLSRGTITTGTAVGTTDGDGIVATAGHSTKNFASEAEFLSYIWRHDKFGASRTNTGGVIDISDFGGATITRPSNQHDYANIIMSDQTFFGRTVMSQLAKVYASRQLKARCFLLHEVDYADVIAWSSTEAGLELTSEIVKDGYKYATIAGYTFVTTVRDNPDIVAPGQIFCFPDPQFLGRFLILENTKFWIEKRGRFISMEAWEEAGMGFGNIKGLSVLLLSGASITLPAVWKNADDSASTVGANGNETGYDSTNDGKSITLINSLTTATIASSASIATEA